MLKAGIPKSAPRFDTLAFRKACGQFMTGVTIVTTVDQDTGPAGLAANSFTSVSLDPPLVLISVDRVANSYRALQEFRPLCRSHIRC